MSAFYADAGGGRFEASEWTRGPWSPDHQHAGPPAALLARALDGAGGIAGGHLARATFEILKPIPIAPVEVSARVVRPGRRVELVEAELSGTDGPLMLARGWRLRREPMDLPAPEPVPPPPGPDAGEARVVFPRMTDVGWHRAMEIRFVEGAFDRAGPAVTWFRMGVELVEGEAPVPRDTLFAAGDAGNGISSVLDFARFAFVNTDLTIHVNRPPEGEWVCLDARTALTGDGIGLAESVLHDERGPLGRALQTLLVSERAS